jgi:hypothetical protein
MSTTSKPTAVNSGFCELCCRPCESDSAVVAIAQLHGNPKVCLQCLPKGPQHECLNCDCPVWVGGTFCGAACEEAALEAMYESECDEAYRHLSGEPY